MKPDESIDEFNKTFITPFDREDIFALSRTIDDVLDYAYSTVSEMEVLKVKATPFMQRMAALLRVECRFRTFHGDQPLEEHPAVANDHAQRARLSKTASKPFTARYGGSLQRCEISSM